MKLEKVNVTVSCGFTSSRFVNVWYNSHVGVCRCGASSVTWL